MCSARYIQLLRYIYNGVGIAIFQALVGIESDAVEESCLEVAYWYLKYLTFFRLTAITLGTVIQLLRCNENGVGIEIFQAPTFYIRMIVILLN